jgi:formylglycine-generating enzyme required for sulfatase activity
VLEAWRELCRELEVADAPEAPGELAWEGRQVVVVRRQREAELRHRSPADATKNQPWGNSLGMRFVPVPRTEVLFSIWPTRVQDFQEFVSAVGMDWSAPPFEQGPTHPAVDVSWNDAQAFCQWLTKKERGARWLTRDQHYRLPKDWEWSVAVGLFETREGVPKDRDEKCERAYPWGTQWPPPWGAGNYGRSLSVDSFDYTSPVGAFTPNEVGLFDLGGNVWEWCEDYYDGERERRVSRGGSWTTQGPTAPLSSYRNTQALLHATGFRVVVAREDSHS